MHLLPSVKVMMILQIHMYTQQQEERGNGVEMIGSLDESKHQQLSEKEVLIWLKENLLNNGLGNDDAKHFLQEFARMKIIAIGGTLYALKNDIANIDRF